MPKTGGKVPTRSYGQIIELELIEDLKKVHKPKKQFAYQIDVTWTDSSTRRVYRSYDQLYELYCSLTAITKDGGMVKLPGRQIFERSTTESFALKHLPHIKHFVDSLLSIPTFMQQSDPFLWFWEPSVDDLKIFDIDRTIENNPKYPQPSATVLKGGTVIVNEDEQDYICVCTALNLFSGTMPPEHQDEKGLSVKEGDVIYVLRMSNCPSGFWQVRNVFGSEGLVPITSLRVDQDILQRKKRRSQRVQQQKRLDMIKSAENLADRSMRLQQQKRLEMIKSAENLADRRKSNRHSSAAPFSPPISRTLRDLNNSIMNYVEPAQPQYSRRRSNRVQAFNDTSIRSDTQATHELIRSLHETSLMLQDRMAMSEIDMSRKRLFDDFSISSRSSVRNDTYSTETKPRYSQKFEPRSRASYIVRSPTKRGPRVSARFKRMSPSPSKLISPCRKGIKGLRVAAPSPLAAGASPSQNVTFEKSPGTGLKRAADIEPESPSKKSCLDDNDSGNGTATKVEEEEPKVRPRRRSDIARRVSLRLKQVYGLSPVRKRVPRRQVTTSANRATSG
ncbi:uncharacterized protein LOC134819101 isoform X2 [Bolinopsis microptera]|uniref:uncharacterized protein LOC134819101 isoform X2 n=1 Tax=Bolinopsis microptera TaxID=2820187 RepID=UPI0030793EE7